MGVAHLGHKQLAVNEPLQGSHSIGLGHLSDRFLLHEQFEADGFVPVAAKDRLMVHRDDNTIDDLASKHWEHCRQQEEKRAHSEMKNLSHQNVCPMLKKMLIW